MDLLAAAVESHGSVHVITSVECFSELQRVLAYPRLALDAARQATALERYRANTTVFMDFPTEPSRLPLCTDPDDQKFLELAWHAQVQWLLTKDNALLEMAPKLARAGRFRIARAADLSLG